MHHINIDELTEEELEIMSKDIVWGAVAISKIINRGERQTWYLLEKGYIPTAKRVGTQWVASKRALLRFLLSESEGASK